MTVHVAQSSKLSVTLGYINEQAYTSLELRNRYKPVWVISHVVSGRTEVVTCGQSFVAEAGDVMIHPPHLPYDEVSAAPVVHQWVLVDLKLGDSIDVFRHYPVRPVVRLRDPQMYQRVFGELQQEWLHNRALRDLKLCNLTTELVALVLEAGMSDPPAEQTGGGPYLFLQEYERFASVIHYMESHVQEKITREDLAAIVNLHPVYFDRAFASIYNLSPMRYLRNVRLRKAEALLAETTLSLDAVAYACGFNDAAYLSKVFRDRHRLSPGQYRQQALLQAGRKGDSSAGAMAVN